MNRPSLEQAVTFCYVRDLQETARFYEDIVGLEMVLDQGSCRIYRVAGEGFLGFCQCREGRMPAPEGVILTLVSQEVKEWAEYLQSKGLKLEKPPTLNPTYNITHLFFRDPDGYLLEIQTFHDPTWPSVGTTSP